MLLLLLCCGGGEGGGMATVYPERVDQWQRRVRTRDAALYAKGYAATARNTRIVPM